MTQTEWSRRAVLLAWNSNAFYLHRYLQICFLFFIHSHCILDCFAFDFFFLILHFTLNNLWHLISVPSVSATVTDAISWRWAEKCKIMDGDMRFSLHCSCWKFISMRCSVHTLYNCSCSYYWWCCWWWWRLNSYQSITVTENWLGNRTTASFSIWCCWCCFSPLLQHSLCWILYKCGSVCTRAHSECMKWKKRNEK